MSCEVPNPLLRWTAFFSAGLFAKKGRERRKKTWHKKHLCLDILVGKNVVEQIFQEGGKNSEFVFQKFFFSAGSLFPSFWQVGGYINSDYFKSLRLWPTRFIEEDRLRFHFCWARQSRPSPISGSQLNTPKNCLFLKAMWRNILENGIGGRVPRILAHNKADADKRVKLAFSATKKEVVTQSLSPHFPHSHSLLFRSCIEDDLYGGTRRREQLFFFDSTSFQSASFFPLTT